MTTPDQLTDYLTHWNLSDPQLLATTATSHIYTVIHDGEKVVLKLLTTLGIEDESRSAAALRYFDGDGAVRLLRHDQHAHLMEYIDGESLIPMVINGQDDKATIIIADVLNNLHSVSKEKPLDELVPLNLWFRDLFRKADDDRKSGQDSLYVAAASLAQTLLAAPREVCVLHGDIHHENIRRHAQRGWLAFDPKGLIGERTYDAANTLCNPLNMPTLVETESRLLRCAGILSQRMGIDLQRVLQFGFVYACLSASWTYYDDGDPSHALRIAEIITPQVVESDD